MSDSPASKPNTPPDETAFAASGWHVPQTPGGWRVPGAADKETPGTSGEEQGGWRVPALPQNLEPMPETQGAWHLPKPEDTTFTPQDEIEMLAPVEEVLEEDTEEALLTEDEASPAEIEELDEDTVIGLPSEPMLEEVESEPVLPFDALPGVLSAPPKTDGAGATGEDMITPPLAYEDDEEDGFSMSELMALASLVEDQPVESAAPAPAADLAASDPAEYARQQLARLAEQAEADSQIPEPALAEPPSAAPALDPQTAALAQKYRETENKVRDLRAQYRAGQLTRDQFQSELRQLMVLDEDQVWWMMGVETDTWYKYDNGSWVPQTPPALAAADAARADTGKSAFELGQTVPTGAVVAEDDYMPLPRAVPVRDPDFTLPGTAGVYIPPTPGDMGATMPVGTQPTVASAPVSEATIPTGAGVPSPVTHDPTAPPSYDIAAPSPAYREAVKRQQRSLTRTILIIAVVGLALLFLFGACGVVAGIAYYSSLASPWQDEITALANYQPQFQTARILDAEGSLIVELNSQEGGARVNVPLRDISPFMIHALVSTENERFFDDPGWDPIAIARAIIQNVTSGDVQSGASTITQQIARNLILHDTTVSAERKLQEIVIASEIAQRYDKNFILQLYLNEVFFGNRSYGVEAASEFYFGHSAADLNMAESALLAGLIQAPATYDPVVNSGAAFDRMETVLERMRRVGCLQFQHEPYLGQPFCIGDQQIRLDGSGQVAGGDVLIEKALVETTTFRPREYTVRYPHFVNFVQAQIEQSFGAAEMYRRGFTIRTTLIPRVQDAAQDALARYLAGAANTGLNTGAVMVTDPATGAIRAMVGSPDFNNTAIDGQVNNVLTWQQPGSSIKPVVYIGALEGVNGSSGFQYLTPASILWDVPTTFNTQPPYAPINYDRQFHGPVALRYALANSYNIPAVKALDFIGIDKFRDVATRMGLRFLDDAQFGLASALGANEVRLYDHIQMYATIANGGQRVPLYAITSVTDAQGVQIALPERPQPTQAIQPQIAYLMASILSDNQARSAAFGLNSGLAIPGYDGLVGAKTGTSNDNRDLWTMGFTTNAVVGVWTGRVDNQGTNGSTATAAIPIWNEVMRVALQGTQPQPFPDPGGIVAMQICGDTGTQFDPNQQCSSARTELFLQNAPPPASSQAFIMTAAVDTWTGLRANQYCSESVETRTFVNISDAAAVQWLASPQGQAYAQQLGLTEQVEALPPQECNASTPLTNIRINQPADGQQVQGQLQVVGSVTAPDFNRYQLEIAPVSDPENFTIVGGPYTNQQTPGAVIGQWDTTLVPNGIYRLRLAAFSNSGGYVFRVVQIGVNNPVPTPTLAPTIAPTAAIPPTVEANNGVQPLPFDVTVSTSSAPPPEVPSLGT